MQIHKSAEDYLETILILHNQKGMVRSIDIANELGFSKPSVSVAMKNLREHGYIEVSPEGDNLIRRQRPGQNQIQQRRLTTDTPQCNSWRTHARRGQIKRASSL